MNLLYLGFLYLERYCCHDIIAQVTVIYKKYPAAEMDLSGPMVGVKIQIHIT